MIRDLYYAAWANLSALPMCARAAIVLAILVVFAWVMIRPLLFKLLWLLVRAAAGLIKLLCLIAGKILSITAQRRPEQYAARYNRMVNLAGGCNERLLNLSNRLGSKQNFHPGRMLLLYGALILLIGLPSLLEPVISKEYIPYFSFASDLYQQLEAPALTAAAAYDPLIKNDGAAMKDPVSGEEPPQEVWLSLSDVGKGGSNIRTGPGTDNQALCVIEGDTQVLYLEERSGRWVHIRTVDGVEGWIHDSLVAGLPEEAPK